MPFTSRTIRPSTTRWCAGCRGSRLDDDRFTESGSSVDDVDAFLPHLLDFLERPHTKAEIEGEIEAHFGEPRPRAWWALRSFAPLHHAPTGGPWSFGPRQSFVAAGRRSGRGSPDESEPWLVRRYLEAFGPASARTSRSSRSSDAPAVAEACASSPTRSRRWRAPVGRALLRRARWAAPGRGHAGSAEAAADVGQRPAGICGPQPGDPAGLPQARHPHQRRRACRRSWSTATSRACGDRSRAASKRPRSTGCPTRRGVGLETEARALVAFLAERDPAVYRRYAHWWAKLPDAEVRLLPG